MDNPQTLADDFSNHLKTRRLGAGSIVKYRAVVQDFLKHHNALGTEATAYINEKKQTCGGRYLIFASSVLRQFFKWWSLDQLSQFKPVLPASAPPARPAFTEDEVKWMLMQADTECARDSLVLRLLAMGGLKRCDLQYIRPNAVRRQGKDWWIVIKRPRGPYNAPIDAGTAGMLMDYKPCDHPNAALEKPPWGLSPCAIRKIVQRYRRVCGVKTELAGCMAFRRAYATGRHKRGAGIKELQADMGLEGIRWVGAAVKGHEGEAGYNESKPLEGK